MSATIFIADDNPSDIDLLKLAFEDNDFSANFVVARDGAEAIALLGTTQPDLVLLDIKMPKVDGLEVLGWLRSQPRLNAVPVIIMSSSAARNDQHRAHQLGTTQYWSKASRFKDVVQFVASLKPIVKAPGFG